MKRYAAALEKKKNFGSAFFTRLNRSSRRQDFSGFTPLFRDYQEKRETFFLFFYFSFSTRTKTFYKLSTEFSYTEFSMVKRIFAGLLLFFFLNFFVIFRVIFRGKLFGYLWLREWPG